MNAVLLSRLVSFLPRSSFRLSSLALPVLLYACAPGATPKPDSTAPCDRPAGCGTTPAPDADGDGYVDADAGGDDCDDADPAVHPGATETWYDGVDQDCDGAWDFDQDGDGEDVSDVGGRDCDDTDPEVPAEETFNRKDDDCDGCVDEPGGGVVLFDSAGVSLFVDVVQGSASRERSAFGWVWLSDEGDLYDGEACWDGVTNCHPVTSEETALVSVEDREDVVFGKSTWFSGGRSTPGLAIIFWNAHGDCFADPPGGAYADLGCPTFDCGVNW